MRAPDPVGLYLADALDHRVRRASPSCRLPLRWMWPLIGALAVLGLSANEPSALLVVLVVLRSGRHRGAAFVAGWITALIVVVAGAGFVARLGFGPRRGGPRRVLLVIELVVGVGLLGWSAWCWLHNRGRVLSEEVPRTLTRLTSIRGVPSFFTAVLVATYPPAVVAGTTLLRSNASMATRLGGLVTFVVVGTLMVAFPVVATYVSPVWAAAQWTRCSTGRFGADACCSPRSSSRRAVHLRPGAPPPDHTVGRMRNSALRI